MWLKFQPSESEEAGAGHASFFQFLEIKAVGPSIVRWKKAHCKTGCVKATRRLGAWPMPGDKRVPGSPGPGTKGPFSVSGEVLRARVWRLCSRKSQRRYFARRKTDQRSVGTRRQKSRGFVGLFSEGVLQFSETPVPPLAKTGARNAGELGSGLPCRERVAMPRAEDLVPRFRPPPSSLAFSREQRFSMRALRMSQCSLQSECTCGHSGPWPSCSPWPGLPLEERQFWGLTLEQGRARQENFGPHCT